VIYVDQAHARFDREFLSSGNKFRAGSDEASMQFQFDMSNFHQSNTQPASAAEVQNLLQQLLEIQREQLVHLRNLAGAHDGVARWRAFLERWQDDFSQLPSACRQIMPILERSYGKLVSELTEHLVQNDGDTLENDFELQEFLDRYGMRLSQLGTILNLVAPFAEVASQNESR
jgi:hypothetical protein